MRHLLLTCELYRRYSYVQSPNQFRDLSIYVVDTGVYEKHSEFQAGQVMHGYTSDNIAAEGWTASCCFVCAKTRGELHPALHLFLALEKASAKQKKKKNRSISLPIREPGKKKKAKYTVVLSSYCKLHDWFKLRFEAPWSMFCFFALRE